MNDLIGAIVLFGGIFITLIAFFTVMELLFPAKLGEISAVAERQPGRSLLIGAVNFLFFGVVALACFGIADARGLQFLALPGLLISITLALAITAALSAVVQLIGQRITPNGSRIHRSLSGGVSLTLACMLPVVGWFALLPYVTFLGLGALIINQASKRQRTHSPQLPIDN